MHFRRHSSGPPYNPGVGELVSGKQCWSGFQTPEESIAGFRGWHERGYLPHFDKTGLTQFITFRLADAFPAELRAELNTLMKIEDEYERRHQFESLLDKGHGTCYLCRPDVAALVEDALRFFHGRRYELCAWVVMPNHVHVLVRIGQVPMSEVVGSWKSHTAKVANKLLKHKGRFWAPEYWDTYMRNAEQELRTVKYIEENPARARLVRSFKEWPWSSARFRDEFGRLKLPA